MDLAPAVQEAARLWEPNSVPRETAPETVRCLSSRKPMRSKHEEVVHMQHSPRVLSSGALPDAMSGGIRDAATIQPADEEGQELVDG